MSPHASRRASDALATLFLLAFAGAAWLLLAVGTLLGLNFPLGKLAQAAQVPAVLWAALISLGASSLLGAWLLLRRRPVVCDAQHARYFVITALVSYALPNLLVLAAMAHLGSGPTAMMFTLSPLFTALLSRLAGLRAPARLEYWGIAIGFGGALLVALARGEAGRPAAWLWVGVGLLVPLLLALSTSSPFWMGHATGLMGYRQTAYQEIPRTDCRRCSATRPNTTTTCSA